MGEAAQRIIEVVLVVTCGSCLARLAITHQPSMGREPHLYGIECPSCGRITMRRVQGVLLRVADVSERQA